MITFSRLGNYGQLCNQVWQYAFLLGHKAKHGYEIRIPRRRDLPKKAGLYELDCFPQISAGTLPMGAKLPHVYREQVTGFDPEALERPDGTDFLGYFQSWRYFEHCPTEVRRELTFRADILLKAQEWLRQPGDGPQVSVNVRRGDYLQYRNTHMVCDANYYLGAMAEFPGARFYVISDDIAWCRRRLTGLPGISFLDSPNYVATLAAMTLCRHHIGSASSFSWWGAWLSPPGGRAIFPEDWYTPGALRYSIGDLIYPGAETRPTTASED